MQPAIKKETDSNIFKPEIQQKYVHDTHNALELLHKELDINLIEQSLLSERIDMMKKFINDLPSFDSEYSTLAAQIQMDQIELDEVKQRENKITEEL